MKWLHDGIVFSNREIVNARRNLNISAFNQVKELADKSFSYKVKVINGILSVPRFYVDRIGHDKAVYRLEKSAQCMIACANIYAINKQEKYANKVKELADAWTNSIDSYANEQAQFEGNWHLQTMTIACEMVKANSEKDFSDFFKWDRKQCLKLIKLNRRENNLLYWLGAHAITSGIANEDRKLFDYACQIYKTAIKSDIIDEGQMPKETAREYRGIHYTFFAIDPLIFIAEAAKHQGKDLFSYSYKGKSILTAIKYILPYIKHPETWHWSNQKQDFSVFPRIHSGWCEVAYREYRLKGLKDFLEKNRPIFDPRNGGAGTLFHGSSNVSVNMIK